MFSNPYAHVLMQRLKEAKNRSIQNLDDARRLYIWLKDAQLEYEHAMFKLITPLSKEQQVSIIASCLDQFRKDRRLYIEAPRHIQEEYVDGPTSDVLEEWMRRHDPELKNMTFTLKDETEEETARLELLRPVFSMAEAFRGFREEYDDYEYLFWLLQEYIDGNDELDLSVLSAQQSQRLQRKIISEVYEAAQKNTLRQYESVTEAEPSALWILNWAKWRDEHGSSLSSDKPAWMHFEKLASIFFESDDQNAAPQEDNKEDVSKAVDNNEVNGVNGSNTPGPLLTWEGKGGAGDMAELIYKLERGGFINLGFYKRNGGSIIELSRRLCYVFQFKGSNPIGNLNSYLGKIKEDDLGIGEINELVMRAIGRKKGGRMSDILPTDPVGN